MNAKWKNIGILFLTFLKIGAFTFGGGYAMIALLENELITRKRWLTQPEFLDMVAIAESTPGPVAINSATYIGFRIAGFGGAAAATVGVCIPSFAIIYAISRVFDAFLSLRWVACAFRGIQACVVYLILSAGIKMLRALPRTPLNLIILCAVGAAMIGCALAGIGCSSIVCILACGAVGLLLLGVRRIREKAVRK